MDKRKIIPIVLLVLMIPQLALAAWWNPLTWFDNWSFLHKPDTETQALENRVKELEDKLATISTTTAPTTTPSMEENASTTSSTKTSDTKPQKTSETPAKKDTQISNTISRKTTPVIPPKPKTFTTPSGAVIDDAGNVISPPTNTTKIQGDTSIKVGATILSSEDIYTAVSPAVVLVFASMGNGSGFVVDNGRYTITNAHVVGDDKSVTLKFQSGLSFNAVVLGKNESVDLALLFNGNRNVPSLTLGSSGDILKIGADVYALGFPLSISQGLSAVTFTKGTLSARQNVGSYPGILLQHDAPINHGNSGGPLVDNKGEVIGVNASRPNDDSQGIYFAIPVDTVKAWIPTLSQYGQSRYEVYPIGSTQTIKRSVALPSELNEKLSCEQLGFTGNDLAMCNLYKNYHADYIWKFIEDL